MWSKFEQFKTEHLCRTKNYDKYEMMANAEVVSRKPDLPNVSSGEVAGMVRRIARNVVQHTPNVEIVTRFDDDSQRGILAKEVLRTKVIGDVLNSNQMQQNLFASVMTAFTVGFDAVCPVLVQRADKSWVMEYDVIHYNDVFPEPGVKDVRKAPEVFVRRYLTKGEVAQLIRTQPAGWDIAALRTLFQHNPPSQQRESVAKQNSVHHVVPDGYEIITWYSRSGDPFLTFDARHKLLLRIERNTDPQLRHPVHFLILERDPLQPLGKPQIALIYGRQEFQDLMLRYQSFMAPFSIRSWKSWRPISSSTWDFPSGCWLSFSSTRKCTGWSLSGCLFFSMRSRCLVCGENVRNGSPLLEYQVMTS